MIQVFLPHLGVRVCLRMRRRSHKQDALGEPRAPLADPIPHSSGNDNTPTTNEQTIFGLDCLVEH